MVQHQGDALVVGQLGKGILDPGAPLLGISKKVSGAAKSTAGASSSDGLVNSEKNFQRLR
jgi:hypothetical protein